MYNFFIDFVCKIYQQKIGMLTKLADLRCRFYSQKQSRGGNMLPTAAVLRPAIRRCHYQCMEWLQILSDIQIFHHHEAMVG